MLYKKFHRNYISQFKVGTKIKLYHLKANNKVTKVTATILRSPYIDEFSQICIIDNLNPRCLFSHNGKKIQEDMEIVDE